jgi:hypothetical protein
LTCRVPMKGFQFTSCSLSPFPKLSWHNGAHPIGRDSSCVSPPGLDRNLANC